MAVWRRHVLIFEMILIERPTVLNQYRNNIHQKTFDPSYFISFFVTKFFCPIFKNFNFAIEFVRIGRSTVWNEFDIESERTKMFDMTFLEISTNRLNFYILIRDHLTIAGSSGFHGVPGDPYSLWRIDESAKVSRRISDLPLYLLNWFGKPNSIRCK